MFTSIIGDDVDVFVRHIVSLKQAVDVDTVTAAHRGPL